MKLPFSAKRSLDLLLTTKLKTGEPNGGGGVFER